MLELHLKSPNELELRLVDSLPFPQGDEVKIKLLYAGICGSDLGVYRGKLAHATYPLRPGHELLGTVIEAGEQATFPLGTRVVILPNTFCGECEYCQAGKTNICPEKKSMGVNQDGGFSEEFIISSKFVFAIPDGLTDKRAVLIEPFAVVVHALKNVAINKGTRVAIVGSGNEGMLAAALSYHLGAQVTAIDINPNKLELVRSLGGDIRAVYPQEVEGESFEVVIEAAGTKQSVEQAFHLAGRGGAVVLIGLTAEAALPVTQIVRNEVTIYGSIIYNFPEDYQKTVDYLSNPAFNIEPIISRVLPLSDYQEAYNTALSGDYGKVIFKF
ncbi:zinc-binding dehydrogenase [Ammoniphilus sp. YIM 78166]|uniref:zinc-dependent alcohol dehydrogenase n=1 Tax=Ammoniphilus sp. YIM 78166 TaxID=1644106 RepID=UPI00106F9E39|nr:alcohol dehydrogenase catalytic domain-containing protein [Ammoniphilus sp. YIM 78166]